MQTFPCCLKCNSIKYPRVKTRYHKISVSVSCGNLAIDPTFLLSPNSLYLCHNCYNIAYQDPYCPGGKEEALELSCEEASSSASPTQAASEPQTITLFHFRSLDPEAPRKKQKLASIHTTVLKHHRTLPDHAFQHKIAPLFSNPRYFDDFVDVISKSPFFPHLMKSLFREHESIFQEISLLLSLFGGFGQKKMKNVIRNGIFIKMVPFFHFNPICTADKILDKRREMLDSVLYEKLGYCVLEKEGRICIVGNLNKILLFLLEHPGTKGVYQFPKGVGKILLYADAHPYFRFSDFCNSQASIQLQILSPHHICDIWTICRWFGDDDYEFDSLFGPAVYSQFNNCYLSIEGQSVDFSPINVSDGKTRRSFSFFLAFFRSLASEKKKKKKKKGDSGKSSACSSYGLPEGPLRKEQYSDFSIISKVISTAERTNAFADVWDSGEWNGKKHNKGKSVICSSSLALACI